MTRSVRNALNVALADGLYLRLDTTNDPLTGNLHGLHSAWGDGSIAPSVNHSIIAQEFFTVADGITKVGAGIFPHYNPVGVASNQAAAIQGNQWFGTTNWGAGAFVRCLDFFPAPDTAVGVSGSVNLDLAGVTTGGLLNVGARAVTANNITGVAIAPYSSIFGGAGQVNAVNVRGLFIAASLVPILPATITGRVVGIQVNDQPTAVNIALTQGIWLNGTGAGADLVLGPNNDGRIYHSGANLIIDPDNFQAGERVFIGVTGDDDLLLNNIEIDGNLNHDGAGVGFYGTAPIAQPGAAGAGGWAAGIGVNPVVDLDTFTGGVGLTGYTIGDLVAILKNFGLIAP